MSISIMRMIIRGAIITRSTKFLAMKQSFGKNVKIKSYEDGRIECGYKFSTGSGVNIICCGGEIWLSDKIFISDDTDINCYGYLKIGEVGTIGKRNIISVRKNAKTGLGVNLITDRDVELACYGGELIIGDNCYIGHGTTIACKERIVIGPNTMLADLVSIRDHNHRFSKDRSPFECGYEIKPVVIGENCWIGTKVTILAGVTLGRNVVIGANSVVTHDFKDGTVAAGCPAREIKCLL